MTALDLEKVVTTVPALEELRALTDAAWAWHHHYDQRARITLKSPLPCPVCLHDPNRHRAAEHPFTGCADCGESATYGNEPAACPMTPDLIALAYADRGFRTTLAQLEQVRALHHAWGNANMDALDVLALWEDLGRILGGAA